MQTRAPAKGLMTTLKSALNALVLAQAGRTETGAQATARLTGLSAGQISKAVNFDRPEMLSLIDAATLEAACGQPILAEALASLTGHRLVSIDTDEAGNALADMVRVAESAAKTVAGYGEALADGRVSAGEARALMAALGHLAEAIQAGQRTLAPIAGHETSGDVVALKGGNRT